LIDTHTHLDSSKFLEDIDEVVNRALSVGVTSMYLPNVDDESLVRMNSLQERYPNYIELMLGLHPCEIKGDWEKILDRYDKLWEANPSAFIAVGEIGLDLYWDKSNIGQQIQALNHQLDWCLKYDKPFSMHVRDAWEATLKVLRERKCPELKGVLHCFSGSLEIARELIDMGHYLGIGGVATFKNSNIANVLSEIGLDRIVLETDSPYLAPVPHRGKRNESSHLQNIAIFLSDKLGYSVQEIDTITSANARSVFLK
tara:strand:+ start:8895 stop:9662 length:768 start_codon:yes stop_codon:yes gene_type:complete